MDMTTCLRLHTHILPDYRGQTIAKIETLKQLQALTSDFCERLLLAHAPLRPLSHTSHESPLLATETGEQRGPRQEGSPGVAAGRLEGAYRLGVSDRGRQKGCAYRMPAAVFG